MQALTIGSAIDLSGFELNWISSLSAGNRQRRGIASRKSSLRRPGEPRQETGRGQSIPACQGRL